MKQPDIYIVGDVAGPVDMKVYWASDGTEITDIARIMVVVAPGVNSYAEMIRSMTTSTHIIVTVPAVKKKTPKFTSADIGKKVEVSYQGATILGSIDDVGPCGRSGQYTLGNAEIRIKVDSGYPHPYVFFDAADVNLQTRKLRVDDIGKTCEVNVPNKVGFTGMLDRIWTDKATGGPMAEVSAPGKHWTGHEDFVQVVAASTPKFINKDIGVEVRVPGASGSWAGRGPLIDIDNSGPRQRVKVKYGHISSDWFYADDVERLPLKPALAGAFAQESAKAYPMTTGTCDECQGTGMVDLFAGLSPCSKGCKP